MSLTKNAVSGLDVVKGLFGWGKRKRAKQGGKVVDPATAVAQIGVLGLDRMGNIAFCNTRMLEILEEAIGRRTTHRQLSDQPLAKVLGVPLSRSVIGYSLAHREELTGIQMKIGNQNLLVSTMLLWGVDRQTPLGCIGYYIPYVPTPTVGECPEAARYMVKRLASEKGYSATDWISDISLEHATQFQKCLARHTHTIPNPRYCAFAMQCAFNPVYGYFSLERRRFYRVPIGVPVRIFIDTDGNREDRSSQLVGKYCEGQTINLSLGGVCFESVLQFPTGLTVEIEFLLSTPITCRGQVVWNGQSSSGEWKHGIRFSALGKDERVAVLRLVSSRTPVDADVDTGFSAQDTALANEPAVIRALALLLRFLKAKDGGVFAHSLRTAYMTKVFAESLRLPERELRLLRYAAALHDLGKLEIDRNLLNSDAALSPDQKQILRNHPANGARLLGSYPALAPLSVIVHHHHERFDGKGYPDGLAGKEIPYLSRILAVADSIDAMANPRPYRRIPLSHYQILGVLEKEAGGQFDPVIAEAAIRLLSEGSILNTAPRTYHR